MVSFDDDDSYYDANGFDAIEKWVEKWSDEPDWKHAFDELEITGSPSVDDVIDAFMEKSKEYPDDVAIWVPSAPKYEYTDALNAVITKALEACVVEQQQRPKMR